MKPRPVPKTSTAQTGPPQHQNDDVAETQLQNPRSDHVLEGQMDDYQVSSDDASDYSDAEVATNRARKSKPTEHETQSPSSTKHEKPANVVKRAARKIKASAHANFCKLKIKNKNSKAKGGGRFGRK